MGLVRVFLLASVLFGAVAAEAATSASANNFSPSLDGGPYVTLSGSRTLEPWRYHLGAAFNYARNPLIVGGVDLIQNLLMADLYGAIGIADWFDVGLGLPVALWNAAPGRKDFGLGDLRLEPKFQIVDIEQQPVGLAVSPFLLAPTGSDGELVGNGSFSGGVRAAFDVKLSDKATLGLNIGYLIRDNFTFPGTITDRDDSYLIGLGLSVRPHEVIDLFGEFSTAILAKAPFDRESETPAEGLLGVRYHTELDGLDALLGGGAGFTFGYGTPSFRGLLGVTYTRPVEKIAKLRAEPVEVMPSGPAPEPEKLEIRRKIHFEKAKASLRPVSHPLLDDVVLTLRDHPEIRKLEIRGHADGGGGEAANIKISTRRAESVRQYLTEHGVEPERLVIKGYGTSHPVDSNETELGRARNRRVDFEILERTDAPRVEPSP